MSETKIEKSFYKEYLVYIIAIGIFIVAKFLFQRADTNHLRFLLAPTDFLVGKIIGSGSTISSEGYFHSKFNIIIDKSCSGFNFFILCFIMLFFLITKYYKGITKKLMAIPLCMFISYIVTILANTSRITTSVFLIPFKENVQQYSAFLHQAEGAFIYLFYLIATYIGVDLILKKHHEKFIES